jgi:TonB family protein
MHPRHGIIVGLAAAGSLLLHAAVLSSFRSVHIGTARGAAEPFEEMTINLVPPESAEQRDKPKPRPREFDIGEVGADGYASHKTAGDRTAIARQAPVDQAALSLDPVGTDLRPERVPGDAGKESGEAAAPAIALALPPVSAPQIPHPATVMEPPPDLPRPLAPAAAPPPAPAPLVPMVAVPEPPPTLISPQRAIVVPPSHPVEPTANRSPTSSRDGGADPAPMGDSESDAFSVLGSAQFINGELRVRAGRKVRSRRPRIGLAGQLDAVYSRMEVTLRVATDKAGKVTSVEIAKSSGSNEIDQPCRVSMYDWWFEPKKDKAGNPVPDVFNFTIGFQ